MMRHASGAIPSDDPVANTACGASASTNTPRRKTT